jgi:UDPglucose--hexose-1-phosphate uridylyltransferase
MSEFRQDRMTGEWVIVAPERRRRLKRSSAEAKSHEPALQFDPACPFCPGNEVELPSITAEVSVAEQPGWQVRVVPNKYPAVKPDTSQTVDLTSYHRAIAGVGTHEVVIESPRHDADLASMSSGEIEAVLSTYRRRFTALLDGPGIEVVILFRNHGSASGASLAHPHSQLIALSMIPPWLAAKERWARQHHSCVTCEELELERRDGRRLIEETLSFVAMVPFAATVPFEILLVPKRHCGSFAEIDNVERADLARLLQRALQRLRFVHGDPPYNLLVESASRDELATPHTHWRLRIAADLVKWGGFELGTRMPINPSCPEEDAVLLRNAIAGVEADRFHDSAVGHRS